MSFDTRGFMAARFEPRTEAVAVQGLSDWFGDAEPVWTVRGQTASEIARANAASDKHKAVDSIVKAIAANADKVGEIRKALGVSTDTPADIVKRLEQLVMCSVAPTVELDVAVKLAEVRPVEFYILTNKIVELTALGMDIKKSSGCGTAQDSAVV